MSPRRSQAPRHRLKPEQRRTGLLEAATTLTAAHGLDRLTMADVAAAAGVSEGLLYYYFPTRQALTVALVDRAAHRLIAALQAVPDGPPRA